MNVGTMKNDACLAGTDLELYAGESVVVEPADEPGCGSMKDLRRVSPLSGEWDNKYIIVHTSDIGPLPMEEHWGELWDQAQPNHIEGDGGLRSMNEVAEKLGYRGDQYMYGSPLESFLSDNPGAIEAIVAWIATHPCEEWVKKLKSHST